jgi:LPS-assembly protein
MMRAISKGLAVGGVCALPWFASEARAAEACVPDILMRPPAAEVPPGAEGLPIELEGDEVESVGKDIVTMRGNAMLKRGRETLTGDEISYYRETDEVEASGQIQLQSGFGDKITADYIRFQVETHIGEAENVQYRLAKRDRKPKDPEQAYLQARGAAETMYMEGHDVARFENVTYTTCNEGNDDVIVSAKELTLDQGTGEGVAKNVKVKFKNVPIFYFPRISFPISDERKTGFLFPIFGVQENSGFVLAIPWYWNIAPNYDATIIPRVYTDRGVQLGSEFRYLTEGSEGYVYGEYLPKDSKFNDDDRAAFTYKHQQQFTPRLSGNVDVQWVSDEQYFDDFSNDIQISSSSFLPQRAELLYLDNIWRVQGRVFAYQSVDDNVSSFSEPYDRLPQLRARARVPWRPYGLRMQVDGELVNFAHDERIEGWRADLTPEIYREFDTVWGFFTPRAALRYTGYNLDNVDAGDDDSPSRALPVLSVDTGLFFERRSSWLGNPFTHTLEPRLFYVYIPEKDQDDLPVFDTNEINLNNFSNAFRENRFFGADRVGDANQVTVGLTSRMIDSQNGVEWMRGSIGQIFFFEDREVTLPPGRIRTEDTSDFLAEVQARLTAHWTTSGYLQYNVEDNNVRVGRVNLDYRIDPRRFVDLEYRFTRDSIEQVGLRAQWPIGPRWQLLVEELYSIQDSENLFTELGVEYDGCCWKVRAFGQRRVLSDESVRYAFIMELELTGLARVRAGI